MARTLDERTKARIHALFVVHDVNRSGTIDAKELGGMLRALGLCPSNAQVKALLTKYDKNGDHVLNKPEFVKMYQDEMIADPNIEGDIKQAFKAFDTDNSGKVSRKELKAALTTMGEPLSEADVNQMFAAVQLDDVDALDYTQFRSVMLSRSKGKVVSGRSNKLSLWAQLRSRIPGTDRNDAEQKKKRFAMFRNFDPNGNGYLSLAEVDAGCRKQLQLDELTDDLPPILMRAFTNAKKVRAAQGKNKKHGDNYVERSEFRLLLKYIYQYFELWFMFDEIDTSDDRRVSQAEFKAAASKIAEWGVKMSDPDATFKTIDTNGGGIILFEEFCDWAIGNRLDADGEGADSENE